MQTARANIVFDFWKDPFCSPDEIPMFIQECDKKKPLYVLVSHHHKDHYTKKIFEWDSLFCKIHYIISKDTAKFSRHILNPDSLYKGFRPRPDDITVLKPDEVFNDGVIKVEAFQSTDIGNSYAISIDGMTVFHAGDLNAWIWKGESTEEEVRTVTSEYEKIIDSICSAYPSFDYVMFPVDSRIGAEYFRGAEIFVSRINVGHFFPMHFGLGETAEQKIGYRLDAAKAELYMNPLRGEYICLQAPYSSFAKGKEHVLSSLDVSSVDV